MATGCTGCGHVWRQDTSKAAEPRAKLSRRGLRWALEALVCQQLTVARVAEGLAVSWNTANDAALAEGKRVLIEDPSRFEGVKVIGDDEHVWRQGVEVVAMDGFSGFKTATSEALDRCRRRVQLAIHGHRGHKGDPLYAARRTLHTGADLLTDKQRQRLADLFAADAHVEVEATWGIYQRMIVAYREPDRTKGRETMNKLVASVSRGVPARCGR